MALKLRGAAAAIKTNPFPFRRPPHPDSFKRGLDGALSLRLVVRITGSSSLTSSPGPIGKRYRGDNEDKACDSQGKAAGRERCAYGNDGSRSDEPANDAGEADRAFEWRICLRHITLPWRRLTDRA